MGITHVTHVIHITLVTNVTHVTYSRYVTHATCTYICYLCYLCYPRAPSDPPLGMIVLRQVAITSVFKQDPLCVGEFCVHEAGTRNFESFFSVSTPDRVGAIPTRHCLF